MNQQHPPLTPEEAKASLGFATMLQDKMIPQGQSQQDPNAPVAGDNSPQNAPGQSQAPQMIQDTTPPPKAPPQPDMQAEMDAMKTEIRDTIKSEMEGFKKIIKDALQN